MEKTWKIPICKKCKEIPSAMVGGFWCQNCEEELGKDMKYITVGEINGNKTKINRKKVEKTN